MIPKKNNEIFSANLPITNRRSLWACLLRRPTLNKIVSVRSEQQAQKSPETPSQRVPITSLKKAIEVVNAQDSLSTEILFKTLLVYYKPDQGRFATPREQAFLTAAIKKGDSSQVPVSVETQRNISLAIRSGRLGDRIPTDVALAIATKLDMFTDPEAQRNIAWAICDGKFGTTIPTDVARAIATKLDTFTAPEAQRSISLAICNWRFGDPSIPRDVALTIATKLDMFTDPEAQRLISAVISDGKFGTTIPPDVARALVSKLGTFIGPEAQRNISLAICNWRFGDPSIPRDVALTIATKLDMFTDPEAQQSIAVAIYSGRFGNPIPENVALAIATKLDTFTDTEAQGRISLAILVEKFGNPIRDEVALAIVSKLATFKEEAAQRNIALAIFRGRFGEPIRQDVALAIAAKLATFTDPEAQAFISRAIAAGIFGDRIPQAVALALVSKLGTFIGPEAQRNISRAISDGKFGNPIRDEVALAIATNLDTFIAPEAQRSIAAAICSVTFGTPMSQALALAIVSKLDTFTDPEAQQSIAVAIYSERFGNPIPENVALAIATKLDTFTDPEAQQYISMAILYARFGTPIPPAVALALAAKLATFTDPEAKHHIASAICLGRFGDPTIPSAVALAIATKLDTFTAPEAQRNISLAISEGKFGNPIRDEVALAIATKLDTFTDPGARRNISGAIYEGRFGPTLQTLPPEVKSAIMSFLKEFSLSAAIKNFGRLSAVIGESPEFKQSALQAVALPLVRAYTETERVLQQYEAVKNLATGVAKFNCDAPPLTLPTAFKSIERNLAAVLSSPPAEIATCFPGFQALIDGTQQFKGLIASLAAANTEKNALLADDSATDAAKLASSQRITHSADAVKAFDRTASAFTDLGTLEATITTAKEKLARLKPDLASELASQLRPVPFGAQTVPMTAQTIAHLSGLAQVDLTDIFGDNQRMTYLLYVTQDAQQSELPGAGAAATDATAKRPKLLLTYDCSTPAAREAFQGWLSDYSVLYKATVQNVNVYDVSGASPVLLAIRDAQHASFRDLPLFMCKAITDCSFDITAYRHRDELDLIFGEAGILALSRNKVKNVQDLIFL